MNKSILSLLGLFSLLILAACGGNGSTLVGNPNVPSSNKLIGNFSDVEFDINQIAAFDSAFSNLDNDCENDDNVTASIEAGDNAGEIRMINFFDYNSATQNFVAQYDENTGNLSFENIGDETNTITCSGQFVIFEEEILLALDCTVTGDQAEECGATYSKPEES